MDDTGRRVLHLKGVKIDPDALFSAVERRGGYEAVMANKQWQTIRKELNLPHTTSSSTQLREAYIAYKKFEGQPMQDAPGTDEVPPHPPLTETEVI